MLSVKLACNKARKYGGKVPNAELEIVVTSAGF